MPNQKKKYTEEYLKSKHPSEFPPEYVRLSSKLQKMDYE